MCKSLIGSREPGPKENTEFLIPLGKAEIKRSGEDVTIVAVGAMVRQALAASKSLSGEGIETEVVDPRTVSPLDIDTILESLLKTRRLIVVHEAMSPCLSLIHI